MPILDTGFKQDFISLTIDEKGSSNLKSLVTTYNLDKFVVNNILEYILDVVFLKEEPKMLSNLVDEVLSNIDPVGGISPDDFLFVTNDIRSIFESIRKAFIGLGILINGIPPYQFHDHFDSDTLVLRKIRYIDH